MGYRLFDGAGDYGNEKEAGEGVRRAISDGLVKREDLFITSKLWNTFHSKEHVNKIAKMQLGLWGIDYFDLYLVHFPISLKYVDPSHRYPPEWWNDERGVDLANVPLQETWECMEELHKEGVAKNIGLSNCQGSLIFDVLRYAKVQPSVLQVEMHPYLTQLPLLEFCKNQGIAVTAYSSFGPQSYLELGMGEGIPSLFTHDKVASVAKTHGKTTAQVLLRWATQRGVAVIPKSTDNGKIKANLEHTGFDLTDEDLKAINSLNQNIRMNNPAEIDPRMAIFA